MYDGIWTPPSSLTAEGLMCLPRDIQISVTSYKMRLDLLTIWTAPETGVPPAWGCSPNPNPCIQEEAQRSERFPSRSNRSVTGNPANQSACRRGIIHSSQSSSSSVCLPERLCLHMSDDKVGMRPTGAESCRYEEQGTAFQGGKEASGKQWHKGRAAFLSTICCGSTQEREMRSRDSACPSRAGVLPSLSITPAPIYAVVYTLQSHNATTLNVAAAQIGRLQLGCCKLTRLSIFQSVKLNFYDRG